MDKNSMSPVSGRILAENGTVVNIIDLLGGATPISGEVYDIDTFSLRSGRVIGEDGLLYSLADLLKNLSGGSSLLAAQPHLWPTDGSEVDLGDGTFGRRWKRWAGVGPTSAYFKLTMLSPPNPVPSIIDSGGQIWSSFIPSSANAGFVILGGTADFKADGGPWYYSSFEIDQGGDCRLFTQNLQPQEGMDVWVRYTKIS